jgi:hypothetical protein
MQSEKRVYDYEYVNGKRGKRLGVNVDKTAENASHHNVRGHAHTRAFNRAVSNLVGFGEVSADEMPSQRYSRNAQEGGKSAQEAPSHTQPTSNDWDGMKPVFFGKYAETGAEGVKKGRAFYWGELPSKYLTWILENMDPSKGLAVSMAGQEIQRRAAAEAEPVEGEIVDDAELEERFK